MNLASSPSHEVVYWAKQRLRWMDECNGILPSHTGLSSADALHVTMIDQMACDYYRKHWVGPQVVSEVERFEWDVFTRIPYYQEMADRFEAAVWLGDDLVGMGIGEANLKVGYVARDFVERAPTAAGEKMKGLIVPIMNLCLETWAEIKGAGYVCIFDPNLPSIRRLAEFGFQYIDALEVLGEELGPAFYSYCEKRVIPSSAPLQFVYSPVDLEELGEASDPYDRYQNDGHVPETKTRNAQVLARAKGLIDG